MAEINYDIISKISLFYTLLLIIFEFTKSRAVADTGKFSKKKNDAG